MKQNVIDLNRVFNQSVSALQQRAKALGYSIRRAHPQNYLRNGQQAVWIVVGDQGLRTISPHRSLVDVAEYLALVERRDLQ